MTFSIIGHCKDGNEWGIAVASKFLAVGAYVPAAEAGAGAIASQATGSQKVKKEGLELLRSGQSATKMLDKFLKSDEKKDERQIGVIDASGMPASYTGSMCQEWAGDLTFEDSKGSYAIQGNMLQGQSVVEAMAKSWHNLHHESDLAVKLVTCLSAGQEAGGDPRGKQSASVMVVSAGKGYGGESDVLIDLRSDDSLDPIEDLKRMLKLHQFYFGTTPDNLLLDFENCRKEVEVLLAERGYKTGDVSADLYNWMGKENLEERWHAGKIDPIVLEHLRI
jgi:uncharacterized Ntn-hydrolase superfamily protein